MTMYEREDRPTMKRLAARCYAVCAAWLLLAAVALPAGAARLQAVELTTEMRHDPLGIDAAHPRFGWKLDAGPQTLTSERGITQSAYRILVAGSPEALAKGKGDAWDSGRVESSTYWQLAYQGQPLRAHTTYYWQAEVWDGKGTQGAWSKPASFTTGLLTPADWQAQWIASGAGDSQPGAALPLFRHEFALHKPIAQALLFVSGLGQYEARLNGHNVTATVMNPGWTDYRRTAAYDTYNVKPLLHAGANALGVLLGNGMYHVDDVKDRYTKFTGSMGRPKCIVELVITYADGSSERIASDGTWQMHAGPITFSSTYGGEDFDARLEPAGWDRSGFDAHDWHPAVVVKGPGGALRASQSAPLIVARRFPVSHTTDPAPGVTVYDLGENMSGWPAITVRGPAGSSVRLLAGELLDAHGRVTQASAHAFPDAPVLFNYTVRGDAEGETWTPRFSYYGFRYVEVTTTSPTRQQPAILSLTGDFVHADVAVAGTFTTSDKLFNNIHTLIDRAVLSNLVSVLTDCPTREKLGWLEQTHLNASTLMLNYDVSSLYEKMARDMEDAQRPNGLVPSIAPEYVAFTEDGHDTDFRDSPEWGSAIVLSPWALYQFTGDTLPLTEAYPAMQRYIAHLRSRAQGHLLGYGLGDWYDIGPAPPGVSQLTSKYVTATATYYQDLAALAQIAPIAGHPEDAAAYLAEAGEVKQAFNAKFFNAATGLYDRGSQTAQAMPLALGLVPEGQAPTVLAHLIADIHAHQDHVTSGDVGFHYVVRALTDQGRSDILAAMLSRTDSPSYGYQLSRGATTLTEAWDTNPEDSQNHFMLGHGEEWFYRGLAGISIDMARGAENAILLRPAYVAGVASAAATYASAMGTVRSSWRRAGGGSVILDITIPAGATATLHLPTGLRLRLPQGAPGVPIGQATPGSYAWRLGSGVYAISAVPEKTE